MAIEAVRLGFIIDHHRSREEECNRLRDHMGQIVASTIQNIVRSTEESMQGYREDHTLLNKAVWYPTDYAVACKVTNQMRRLEFLQKGGHLNLGYMDKKFFTPLKSAEGDRLYWTWVINAGVRPSEAILAAGRGLSILDCGTVCTIAQYTALLEVLGTAKFDRLFSKTFGAPLVIDYANHEQQPLRYFVSFTEETTNLANKAQESEGCRYIKRGQIVSFNNHPMYKLKHPAGMGSNYNVCCLNDTFGKQTFVAHGLPNPDRGLGEYDIRVFLANEYNKESGDDALRCFSDNHEKLGKLLIEHGKQVEPQFIGDEEVPGLDPFSYQDFYTSLVFDLIQRPIDKVDMDFVKAHPEAKRSIEEAKPFKVDNKIKNLLSLLNEQSKKQSPLK